MMKFLAPALAALMLAAPAMADVMAVWKTEPGDDGRFAHVQIAACGAELCGTIVETFDADGTARPSDFIGRQIVWGMKPAGANAWKGGKIWAPDRDRTYNSSMELNGNVLKVSGHVLVFSRSQNWTRVQ